MRGDEERSRDLLLLFKAAIGRVEQGTSRRTSALGVSCFICEVCASQRSGFHQHRSRSWVLDEFLTGSLAQGLSGQEGGFADCDACTEEPFPGLQLRIREHEHEAEYNYDGYDYDQDTNSNRHTISNTIRVRIRQRLRMNANRSLNVNRNGRAIQTHIESEGERKRVRKRDQI